VRLNLKCFKNKTEIEETLQNYKYWDDFIGENFLRFKHMISGIKHELVHRKIYDLFGLDSKGFVDIYLETSSLETNSKIVDLSIYPYLFVPKANLKSKSRLKIVVIDLIHFIFDIISDIFFFNLKQIPWRFFCFIKEIFYKNSRYFIKTASSGTNSEFKLIYQIEF